MLSAVGRAIVFGMPGSVLAPRLAAALERALSSQNEATPVELVDCPEAIDASAHIVIAADEHLGERAALIERLAEAVARGAHVAVLANDEEAARWERRMVGGGFMPRPLRRINIAGLSGSGKTTLAARFAALDLPAFSLDHEFWWKPGRRPRTDRARSALVAAIAHGDRWIVEGPYYRHSAALASSADLTILLDPPREVASARRKARGRGKLPPHVRLYLHVLRRFFPKVAGARLAHALSQRAHLAPVLRIRTDDEVDALVRGLFRGAGVLEAAAP